MARDRIVYGQGTLKALDARARRRRLWLGDKMDHPDDWNEAAAPGSDGREEKNVSYVVPCTSAFRDDVLALAARRGVNAGTLARAVLLLLPVDVEAWPDPGEPEWEDREAVTLKSGPSAGKVWRRKPRLQVRMVAGLEPASIRRALAVALAMDRGELMLRLESGQGPDADERLSLAEAELARLRRQVEVMAFEPLDHAVRSRADALYILGFPPGAEPSAETARKRYRTLAAIHHPDSGGGDHKRMSQLNAAVRILRGTD